METARLDRECIFSNEIIVNPYNLYTEKLLADPFFYDENHESWVATKYVDVLRILKDKDTFSSERPISSSPGSLGYNFILFCQDPPEHTQLRSFITRIFTTKSLSRLNLWVENAVNSILDNVSQEKFDFAEELAIPLPIMVITNLLGLQNKNWELLKYWTEMIVGHHNTGNRFPGRKAFIELQKLFMVEIDKRKLNPREDIITELLNSEVSGRKLETAEIINFCNTLLIAGNETTASLISNMINLLANEPTIWRQLMSDRSFAGDVIEESLRYDSPVQFISRKIARPTSFYGQNLSVGENIVACIGAANRDPDVFCQPNKFLPTREEKNHLAFSHGLHFCVGAALSRLEAKVVLNAMLDRFKTLNLVDKGERYGNLFFRGFKKLPIATRS